MKNLLVAALISGAALAVPAAAQPAPASREPARLAELERQEAQRAQRERQRRMERARANCEANRGTDCDSAEGLREWVLLERSRAEAVLDRLLPPAPLGIVPQAVLPPG